MFSITTRLRSITKIQNMNFSTSHDDHLFLPLLLKYNSRNANISEEGNLHTWIQIHTPQKGFGLSKFSYLQPFQCLEWEFMFNKSYRAGILFEYISLVARTWQAQGSAETNKKKCD